MTQRVKVSSKNQIAVPSEIRKKLGIKPGDHLLVDVQGAVIVLSLDPKDYVDRMMGLGREIWEGIDVQEYIRGERETCQTS